MLMLSPSTQFLPLLLDAQDCTLEACFLKKAEKLQTCLTSDGFPITTPSSLEPSLLYPSQNIIQIYTRCIIQISVQFLLTLLPTAQIFRIDTIHGGLHLRTMKSYTEVVTIPCSADVYTIQCCLVEQGT